MAEAPGSSIGYRLTQHVIPERTDRLNLGLPSKRFLSGNFSSLLADAATITTLTATTSATGTMTGTSYVATGDITAGAAGFFGWTGRSKIFSAGDAEIRFTPQNITARMSAVDFGGGAGVSPRLTIGDNSVLVTTVNATAFSSLGIAGANGNALAITALTESTTVAAAATTSSTIQFPANSLGLGVSSRVTTVIPTAATFDAGITGATTRYGTGIAVAAGTTNVSVGTTNPSIYAAATSVLYTPNLTPGDATGRIRTTIYYIALTAPTS